MSNPIGGDVISVTGNDGAFSTRVGTSKPERVWVSLPGIPVPGPAAVSFCPICGEPEYDTVAYHTALCMYVRKLEARIVELESR